MSVLTIYNHGTGGSRLKPASDREVVNIFGNQASGVEDVDYMITEGVGSKGAPHRQVKVMQHGGANDGALENQPLTPSRARMKENLSGVTSLAGTGALLSRNAKLESPLMQASGVGVEENIVNALTVVTSLIRAGQTPTKINMIGWSRGAVTCIRIAYFLARESATQGIPINIFAVDPVAGRGHNPEQTATEPDACTIMGNVKNYIATLAVHETRATFEPMDTRRLNVTQPSQTKFAVLPLPGVHGDTAHATNPSGDITFHLAYAFLQKHGSQPSTGLRGAYWKSAQAQLATYEAMMGSHKENGLSKSSGWFKEKTQGGRGVREIKALHYDKTTFFYNAHHKEAFKAVYPTVYEAFFGSGLVGGVPGSAGWWNRARLSGAAQYFDNVPLRHRRQLQSLIMGRRVTTVTPALSDAYSVAVRDNGLV